MSYVSFALTEFVDSSHGPLNHMTRSAVVTSIQRTWQSASSADPLEGVFSGPVKSPAPQKNECKNRQPYPTIQIFAGIYFPAIPLQHHSPPSCLLSVCKIKGLFVQNQEDLRQLNGIVTLVLRNIFGYGIHKLRGVQDFCECSTQMKRFTGFSEMLHGNGKISRIFLDAIVKWSDPHDF